MNKHKWFFNGKVMKIIDGQTLQLGLDLGFEVWKKQIVKFNRVKTKDPLAPDQPKPSKHFLETNIKGKNILCQLFMKKDYNGNKRYYAEIFIEPFGMALSLKCINLNMKSPFRIEGLINLNDLLVEENFSEHFHKEPTKVVPNDTVPINH